MAREDGTVYEFGLHGNLVLEVVGGVYLVISNDLRDDGGRMLARRGDLIERDLGMRGAIRREGPDVDQLIALAWETYDARQIRRLREARFEIPRLRRPGAGIEAPQVN